MDAALPPAYDDVVADDTLYAQETYAIDAAPPPAYDDVVADETSYSRVLKDEERGAVGDPLPPKYGDGGDNDVDETLYSRTWKGEDHCREMDAPPPPYNEGGGDADKAVRSQITRARVCLAIGLTLEVSATLWAFEQAVSAGALDGIADCAYGGRFSKLFGSSLFVENCDGPMDTDAYKNFTETYSSRLYTAQDGAEGYASCDSVADAPTGRNSFEERCTCDGNYGTRDMLTACSWVALSSTSDDICYAQGVFTNGSDGSITDYSYNYYPFGCWASNPVGTVDITITALVVALSSQLLEAVVGFKYMEDHRQRPRTAPMLAVSIFEALGVVLVSSVLLSLPGFYTFSDYTPSRIPVMLEVAWTAVTSVTVGALAEITAECSGRDTRRLLVLGAVGNGLIWFGAAFLEIVVTSYLLWTGAGIRGTDAIVREAAGLFSLELLGLVSMWIARGLWARARLLRSVKALEEVFRKRVIYPRFRQWQAC